MPQNETNQNKKFNSVLQERVNKDKEIEQKNDELRKEYGIEEGRTVGIKVQKDNAIIGIWKVMKDIIRSISSVIIIALAIVGAISLIHPGTRELLLIIWKDSLEQIKTFAPFLPI